MRRTINIKVLAVVIMLTVLFSGVIVNADAKKPDPSKGYVTLELCNYKYISSSSDSFLMDINIKYSFSYDFILEGFSPYDISGCKTPVIEIYDKDLKLIKSSDKGDLTSFLESGKYFVFVYSPDGKPLDHYTLTARYAYSISAQVKVPGSSEYKKQGIRGQSANTSGYGGYWDFYSIINNSNATFDISFKDLPSGRFDLEYEWSKWTSTSTELITKGSSLSVEVGNYAVYRCKVTDKKSDLSIYIYVPVEVEEDIKFDNGLKYDYEIKAFKPSEERVSVIKPLANTNGQNPTYVLYLFDYDLGYNLPVSYSNPATIDPNARSVNYMHVVSYGRAYLYKDLYYFVFDDGAGEKITCNKTYHINKTPNKNEYSQVIYSFTPEKDGTYCFASSNKTIGDPMVVVFDSDRNVVCFDDDGENDFWDNPDLIDLNNGRDIDYSLMLANCKAEAKLTAGKTYYVAVPIMTKSLECDFTVTNKDEPVNPTDPTTPTDSDDGLKFDDFVERLYVVALNRQSEKEGKDYWCELVGNGTLTGADCARFFLTSPEFKGRGLSDEDFLKVLYKTFFDRDAADDPDGFNFWLNSLKTVGKDTVVEGFINSPEWCNICADYGVRSGASTAKATKASRNATAFATRLYTECLGREPEEGGLKYWSLGLTNCELSGSQAAHEFFYCKEFNDHNFDNKELITRMYKTFMGREPDTEGLNYWLGNMNNGMTKDQVFNSFVQSQEFTDICASYAITR